MRDDRKGSGHTVRFKVLWTLWMAGGGIAATAITYVATGSWAWAVIALVASGVILNALGQLVVQPVIAATASRHDRGLSK